MRSSGDARAAAPAAREVAPGSGAMFDRIARRYDLLNRVLSLGLDRAWRRRTAAALELGAAPRVLDLATGTGDLALAILRRHPDATVVGIDPSAAMLAIARDKIARRGLARSVELQVGIAEQLPLADASVDAVTIAFGLRNVPDRERALREMARVTRPGGRVAVLELGEPRGRVLGPLARFHIHRVVPRLGALLSGAREYRYLERSIAAFPPPEEVAAMMVRAGLEPPPVQAHVA
ncbi:MAG TPA: ubiquinone/menaquinone biosynthesis methyltransferase, partial [Kofleriaceae bacterium]|nr:ubiquinone/menaquinone biosynthesis methyltransferase [Kofleriaceae bacterium]